MSAVGSYFPMQSDDPATPSVNIEPFDPRRSGPETHRIVDCRWKPSWSRLQFGGRSVHDPRHHSADALGGGLDVPVADLRVAQRHLRARDRAGPARPRRGTGRSGSSGSWRCRGRGWSRARANPAPRPGTSSRAISRRRGWPRRACPCWPRRTTRPRPPGRCGRAASCRTRAAACCGGSFGHGRAPRRA